MNVKNKLRTLLGIRVERAMPPAGPKPQIGSNIVRDKLRIRLKFPVSDEQWEWFTTKGWRTIEMRTNRRRYTCVPDKVLVKLLNFSDIEREALHQRLISVAIKHGEKKKPGAKSTLRSHTVMKEPLEDSA